MKLLHCLDGLSYGGIQELGFRLHLYDKNNRHDWWAGRGNMAPEMDQYGQVIWPSGPPDTESFDVIVGHGVGGWSYADKFQWAKARGWRTVEVIHSNARSLTPPEFVDGFIGLNHIVDGLNTHMRNRTVIYGIVPPELFDIQDHGGYVGRLSRLVPEKGPMDFVDMARRFPEYYFMLAGDGSQYNQIFSLAPSNLTMMGMVRDFKAFYQTLKLFVFPTQDECCSVSVGMAQAAGVPVICQEHHALRETTGGHALFATSPRSFDEGMIYALLHPEEMREMASRGRQWTLEHFHPDVVVKQWQAMLESL